MSIQKLIERAQSCAAEFKRNWRRIQKKYGCLCQGCGNQFKVDILVPDDIWEEIKPEGKPKGAGLLCGSCIMSRIEKRGKDDYFRLDK